MKHARFLAAARLEFFAEVTYYNETEQGLGNKFSRKVQQATARALALPHSGTPGAAHTRRITLQDFPFALVYRLENDTLLIIALAHHKRKPGYWRSRLKP